MPNINAWPKISEKRVLGFAGFKAGMTHIIYVDDTESPSKGSEVATACTIIEVPPMVVYGVRGYKSKMVAGDILAEDLKILNPLGILKRTEKNAELSSEKLDDVYLLVYTQPNKAKFGRKNPDCMELALGGKDVSEKLTYAKSLLGKELKMSEVFKAGEFVDTASITIGKGLQGAVKRFGVSKQRRKATGKVRHVGTLGPWHPSYVMYTTPMAGQMGYHKRSELNKRIMRIGTGTSLNPKGGFTGYGLIQEGNEFVLLKGSVGGPSKRLIRFRKAIRILTAPKEPAVSYVSTESNQ